MQQSSQCGQLTIVIFLVLVTGWASYTIVRDLLEDMKARRDLAGQIAGWILATGFVALFLCLCTILVG